MKFQKYLVNMYYIQEKQLKDLKFLKSHSESYILQNRYSLELQMVKPKKESADLNNQRVYILQLLQEEIISLFYDSLSHVEVGKIYNTVI